MKEKMFQYTAGNHFRFGYDGKPSLFRISSPQKWWLTMGKCMRNPLDWRSECIIAAREIAAQNRRPLQVLFLGQPEDEVIAEAFRSAKVPFTAAVMRLKDDLNVADVSYAVTYCAEHRIPVKFYPIDGQEFFSGGAWMHHALVGNALDPWLTLSMRVTELVTKAGALPITGRVANIANVDQKWSFIQRESEFALDRFIAYRRFEAISNFFSWRPEQILALVSESVVHQLVAEKLPGATNLHEALMDLFLQSWILVRQRGPVGKFREKVERSASAELKRLFNHHDQVIHIPLVDLSRVITYSPARAPIAELAPQAP